jgi:hypothetical protein
MNKPILLGIATAFAILSCGEQPKPGNAEVQSSTPRVLTKKKVVTPRFPSPAATLVQIVGNSTITINYSRPSVISPEGIDRTGKIWGGLVPFDFDARPVSSKGKPIPWRAGANENTTIEFSDDATVEGQPIKDGKYGLFMAIHEKGGATLILSNQSGKWGSFSYDETEDVLRVEVETKVILPINRLIYTVSDLGKTYGIVALDWEKKRIPFRVSFDVHGEVLTDFRDYLADLSGLKWRDYNKAAAYCADNQVNLEEGLGWITKSLELEKNFTNLMTKSKILAASGKSGEAALSISKALNLPTTEASDFYAYGTSLIKRDEPNMAMEIYQRAAQQWPDNWIVLHGLARGYSANRDFATALKYEKDALTKAPEVNKGFIESAILLLEKEKDFN